MMRKEALKVVIRNDVPADEARREGADRAAICAIRCAAKRRDILADEDADIAAGACGGRADDRRRSSPSRGTPMERRPALS